MEEKIMNLLSKKCEEPIENIVNIFSRFLHNSVSHNSNHGYYEYVDFKFPDGYVKKYSETACSNIIEKFLQSSGRKAMPVGTIYDTNGRKNIKVFDVTGLYARQMLNNENYVFYSLNELGSSYGLQPLRRYDKKSCNANQADVSGVIVPIYIE